MASTPIKIPESDSKIMPMRFRIEIEKICPIKIELSPKMPAANMSLVR